MFFRIAAVASLALLLLDAKSCHARAIDAYNVTIVPDYFLHTQTADQTNLSVADLLQANFGLINRTYATDSANKPSDTQWQRFQSQLSRLQHDAPANTKYKVVYLGVAGHSTDISAEAFYGRAAWSCFYSLVNGNASLTWADADLTSLGQSQAERTATLFANSRSRAKMPPARTAYSSPLRRAISTSLQVLEANGGNQVSYPSVIDSLRDRITAGTANRRGTVAQIRKQYSKIFLAGDMTEKDTLWRALHTESETAQLARAQSFLNILFTDDESDFVSVTTHSSHLTALLQSMHARTIPLDQGTFLPVLLRADRIQQNVPSPQYGPADPVCTCTLPPERSATTSECALATATIAPLGGSPP